MGASYEPQLATQPFAVGHCCIADCNSDWRVDIADAVRTLLELSDQDGNYFCDTQDDVPAGRVASAIGARERGDGAVGWAGDVRRLGGLGSLGGHGLASLRHLAGWQYDQRIPTGKP